MARIGKNRENYYEYHFHTGKIVFNKRVFFAAHRDGSTTPLDLSVRRPSIDRSFRERSTSISSSVSGDLQRLNDGKENLLLNSSNSASPEQIVCAPSLPGSPSTTPSPKRHSPRSSISPRGVLTISPSSLSSLHLNQPNPQAPAILRPLLANELTARLPAEASSAVAAAVLSATSAQHLLDGTSLELALSNLTLPGLAKATSPIAMAANNVPKKTMPPNVMQNRAHAYVKQGVSKCKECNIVFVKHETYLAHKNHYCSARNTADANADGKAKPSPPTSPMANSSTGSSAPTNVIGAYRQLICAACGIKYSTLDNLKTHQTYYCPKRVEIPVVSIKSEYFF